ncbi:MAG TPA: AAA family ATPase [Blastocatellia bacterium]|nr:AAA family ATPase [Blastocatellia bacterium]
MNTNFDDLLTADLHEPELNYEQWRDDQLAARRAFIAALPIAPPQVISEQVEQLGYKGQVEQRRAMSLMAYRHIRRLKNIHVEGISRQSLPPKQNSLLAGPTGCGKTFLIELLFKEIFKLPTVIVDITSFTESGYIGDDVKTILTRLVNAADNNPLLAECGVVCLDEFDKIAASSSNSRFAGEGTTKDVSGYGVQRELLTMLHGAEMQVPMDYGYSQFGPRLTFATYDLPFIACGAFSGLDDLLKSEKTVIGFQSKTGKLNDKSGAVKVVEEVEGFQKYGFLPELIGRFTRIISFQPLTNDTLQQILTDNILPQYEREFAGEGLQLMIGAEAIEHVVTRCLKRGTGARGLHSELANVIEQAAYETFGEQHGKEVKINLTNGRLSCEIQ